MSFVSAPKLTTSAWAGWLAWGLSGREETGFLILMSDNEILKKYFFCNFIVLEKVIWKPKDSLWLLLISFLRGQFRFYLTGKIK